MYLFNLYSYKLYLAGFDGALQIWSTSGTFARPNASNDNAHSKHTWTSSLVYTPDNRYLVSRGGDDTVKSEWQKTHLYT